VPQIVKGGKYVFGWSKVGTDGKIVIPPEAAEEYNLTTCTKVIVIPGSKSSGGFGLTTVERLQNTPLVGIANVFSQADVHIPEAKVVEINGRLCCWVELHDNSITIPEETLKNYGVNPGDLLLSVRGSHVNYLNRITKKGRKILPIQEQVSLALHQ